jgi:hypothetical protein
MNRVREVCVRLAMAVCLGVGSLSVLLVAAAPPAAADCVELWVGVTWSNGPTTSFTPWADGTCLVPTPFGTASDPSGDVAQGDPADPNHPDGVVWDANLVTP